jgi:DNA-binding MarR family transcriptional regulator
MPDTDLALLIDRLMRRIHSGLQSRAAEFDTERVGPAGGMILLTLADMEGCPQAELTRRLARDKSQMTRSITALERKGLLTRTPSPNDARVTLLSLTEQGERVVTDLSQMLALTIDEVLAPLPASERATLRTILTRISP